jgi:hypothetical protein
MPLSKKLLRGSVEAEAAKESPAWDRLDPVGIGILRRRGAEGDVRRYIRVMSLVNWQTKRRRPGNYSTRLHRRQFVLAVQHRGLWSVDPAHQVELAGRTICDGCEGPLSAPGAVRGIDVVCPDCLEVWNKTGRKPEVPAK